MKSHALLTAPLLLAATLTPAWADDWHRNRDYRGSVVIVSPAPPPRYGHYVTVTEREWVPDREVTVWVPEVMGWGRDRWGNRVAVVLERGHYETRITPGHYEEHPVRRWVDERPTQVVVVQPAPPPTVVYQQAPQPAPLAIYQQPAPAPAATVAPPPVPAQETPAAVPAATTSLVQIGQTLTLPDGTQAVVVNQPAGTPGTQVITVQGAQTGAQQTVVVQPVQPAAAPAQAQQAAPAVPAAGQSSLITPAGGQSSLITPR